MKSEEMPRDAEGMPTDPTAHMAQVCRDVAAGFVAAAEAHDLYGKERQSFQTLSGEAKTKRINDCIMANHIAVNNALASVRAKIQWLYDCACMDVIDTTTSHSDVIEPETEDA